MLCDFVSYNKYGTKTVKPEFYYAKHIANVLPKFVPTDAMQCGTIVDEYFAKGPEVLNEYPPVSKRSGKNPKEITNSMNDNILTMIASLEGFKTFQDFIKKEGTINGDGVGCILTGELETTTGSLKIKGKVDFINHTTKQIVDLKTTGSMEKVYDDLMFRTTPNIYARYIRQLAFYRHMASPEHDYECALAVADANGEIAFIPIRKDILDAAWEKLYADVIELSHYYNNGWANLVRDPFGELKEITEEPTL